MPSTSPVVANWELVLRIRERKEQLGVSVNDITRALGFTRNYWSAIENKHKVISESALQNISEILEFDEGDRRQLIELRTQAKGKGWWSAYLGLFDRDIQHLFGLEQGAQQICAYDTLLVPGLLQTADYARAIMSSDITIRPVEVAQRVEARLLRQERLHGDNPLLLTVIMSEAALQQQIGGAAVLRDQLDHLLNVIQKDHIEIRVLPFTATTCSIIGAGTLSLLDFESPRLPRVAWHESMTIWGIVSDTNRVRDIAMAFDEALMHTLDSRKTMEVITYYRKEIS